MRVLLDSVTFLYAMQTPEKLSRRARAVLQNPNNVRELSTLTLAKIALKNATGKLALPKQKVMEAIARLDLRVLPYAEPHAWEAFDVPSYHRDPFDRLLVAQALVEKIPVITCDEQFGRYKPLSVIW